MQKTEEKKQKVYLNTQSDGELRTWLKNNDFPEYRADQVFNWIFDKWVTDPREMINIPMPLRTLLADQFRCNEIKVIDCRHSEDGTRKLLLALADGETIESVIIPTEDEERLTFCLSSQVGCAVRCRFCASGTEGLVRNLHAGEIIEQLLLCCREAGRKPDNLVFMGVGEPMMNIGNMLKALDLISDTERFAMSQRRITVSTSGWTKGIKILAQTGKQYNLAVSLHAPDDATRAKLIPGKNRQSINDIMDACTFYREKTGRMVTFEYTLIAGLNSSANHAEKLAKLAKENRAKINLIPFNQVAGSGFRVPDEMEIRRFQKILMIHGAQVTRRVKKGNSVNAACGQLRAGKRNMERI